MSDQEIHEEIRRKIRKMQRESPKIVAASRNFREAIFDLYGFREEARNLIRQTSDIVVDEENPVKYGFWFPDLRTVYLTSFKHEGAVHEISHGWDQFAPVGEDFRKALAEATVVLGDLDPRRYPRFAQTIKFAYEYTYGKKEPTRDWKGMFATYDQGKWVADPHDIREEEWQYVLTGEIYAGFCSYTMGNFKKGPRALPRWMWQFFEKQFTGEIRTITYYQGGHP